jgi:hypothetical protein
MFALAPKPLGRITPPPRKKCPMTKLAMRPGDSRDLSEVLWPVSPPTQIAISGLSSKFGPSLKLALKSSVMAAASTSDQIIICAPAFRLKAVFFGASAANRPPQRSRADGRMRSVFFMVPLCTGDDTREAMGVSKNQVTVPTKDCPWSLRFAPPGIDGEQGESL